MSVKPDTTSVVKNAHDTSAQSNIKRGAGLALGDIVVFLVFAAVGISSHKEQLSVPKVLITAAPFLVAWFLVASLLGAFKRDIDDKPGKMVQRTLLSWIVAWPVALLFRSLLEWKVPPLSFALVTLITNTIFLLIWRWPYAFVKRSRNQR
jgi:hypothetical protein